MPIVGVACLEFTGFCAYQTGKPNSCLSEVEDAQELAFRRLSLRLPSYNIVIQYIMSQKLAVSELAWVGECLIYASCTSEWMAEFAGEQQPQPEANPTHAGPE